MASTHVNIGNVYQAQSNYEKAFFHYDTELPSLISQLGQAHGSVADNKVNIGIIVVHNNKRNQIAAKLCYKEAYEIYWVFLGRDHHKTQNLAPLI